MISDRLHTSTYNLGLDGHNFWLQYLRHSLLLKYNTKPKLIIYSLDAFTLQKREDLYNSDQFLPYMFLDDDIKEATASYTGYKPIDYELPLIRYYGKRGAIMHAMQEFIAPKNNPVMRIKGYHGQDSSWTADFENAKKKMESYEVKLDTASIRLFERFINECKTQNIQIAFVYTPEYIEGQNFIKNRDKVMGLYTDISKKYGIPFYDYSADTISMQKKYFYNAEHLNKTGADLFTSRFIEKLINTTAFKSVAFSVSLRN